MRNPCRSETDAFWITIGLASLFATAIAAGVLLAPVWGLLVFAAGVAGALVYDVAGPRDDARLREALKAPHRRDGRHMLMVAVESPAGVELGESLAAGAGPPVHVDVVAPVLCSRAHHWASDFDHELEEARDRLAATLEWTRERGLEATGILGDPEDPLCTIEDDLRLFGADEVVVVTHPARRAGRAEASLLDHLHSELDVPITTAIVDREHALVEIKREPARAARA